MHSYPDQHIVKQCLEHIENQLGWGISTEWHNDVFIELSEKIQQKTQVLLSSTTLKRVWGRVAYKSAPSISTLNTLAQFAGFDNWRAYKSQVTIKEPSWFERNITPNLGVIMAAAAVMTLVFISFYSIMGVETTIDPLDYSKIKFKSKSVTKGLPNTVVFDFDISDIPSDSILIQQFWDPTKTIAISKRQTQATGQYYYPGYFRAKLVVDGTIIKEHDLFIESNGWLGTIDFSPIPKYIREQAILNKKLSFDSTVLNEIKANTEPVSTTFQLIKSFEEFSDDNFELKTTIRNVYRDKWAVCQMVRIVVVGTKGAIIIPFSIPGCVSEIGVLLSETNLSGKEHDLSSLGVDFSEFKDVRLHVIDKNVTVFVEDTALFSNKYSESIGNIAGVRFQFLGAGEVANVSISNEVTSLNLIK